MNVIRTWPSPFGGVALHVDSLSTAQLSAMYDRKCGADVSKYFAGLDQLDLYECKATGMRFWRPEDVAGDEAFYRDLSARWPNYYRSERWEYGPARESIGQGARVLEVGCGQGYFLRSIEALTESAVGLELNNEAIADKVTSFPVHARVIDEEADKSSGKFDVVCSFQVLEHVADPGHFIHACLQSLRPGGTLILSTPNGESPELASREDAFDLPPHHLNHFKPETYSRIAALYGLKLVRVLSEPAVAPRFSLKVRSQSSRLLRFGVRSGNRLLKQFFGTRKVSGHTVVAVFRRP